MQIDLAYPAALAVGALLASSGAAMQSLLKNPLAEPYLLGTVGGASLFAVLAINLGLAALGAWVLPSACFLGAAFSLALVAVISFCAARSRLFSGSDAYLRSSTGAVVLAGFVTGSFTGSLQMLALSYSDADTHLLVSRWLFGSLRSVSPFALASAFAVLVVTLGALTALAKALNLMELGRDEAECLGLDTRAVTMAVLSLVALATATAVAAAGAIGFIGLVVPHAVRRRTGPRMQRVLPVSALAGGVVLAAAEALSRLFPGDVPAGVVAAVISAPFFLWLLASKNNGEGWD